METKFKHTPEQARALWAKSLRSGLFGTMESLAVAALLYCVHEDGLGWGSFRLHFADMENQPWVVAWLGLSNHYGGYPNDDGWSIGAADDHGIPHDEIADIIESNPTGLFIPQEATP